MKNLSHLFVVLLAVLTLGCNSKSKESSPATAERSEYQVSGKEAPIAAELPKPEPAKNKPAVAPDPAPKQRKNNFKKNKPATDKAPASSSLTPAPSYAATPEPEAALTVADIYKHFEKDPQTFSLPANKDTTIICQEGTSLYIPANAFVSEETGKEITGPVLVSVKEYYRLSDILLANLSTTSGNQLLETRGMLHLTATSAENENLVLKPGHKIEIGFPYKTPKPDMQLFSGEWKDEKVDWHIINASTGGSESIGVLDKSLLYAPVFPGGPNALKKYLNNTKLPFSLLDQVISEDRYVQFVIDSTGEVGQIKVAQGGDSTVARLAYYVVSNMPKWKPGRINNKPVSMLHIISVKVKFEGIIDKDRPNHPKPLQRLIADARALDEELKGIEVVYFELRSPTNTNDNAFKKSFEAKTNNSTLHQSSISEVNRYLLSTSQLGWINCDRFYEVNEPKIDYVINIGGEQTTSVSVVFHTVKSIIPSSSIIRNNHTVSSVPAGQKVTIVALKTENNQIQLAVKETTTKKEGEKDLIFEPVTMARLKEEMEKLNKLH